MSRDERKYFGEHLRTLRTQQGMTQESLADKAKLHPTYIGGIERGERNIGIDNIFKIAEALGISPADLFLFTSKQVEK
ncbi:MAG: transcriptional regulator [Rhodospirillaceae bacterium]|nr:transcriptional regulator [Rhodospirillaceae bacterium]MBB55610.1 transcriptional regulator [Rhodospirillaceae bacterium]|tara:strand:- start:217 stop:450 length:234 start_codon:yes stop_codon:yes gene_type:complete